MPKEHKITVKEKSLVSTIVIPYRVIEEKGFDAVMQDQLKLNEENLRKAYFNEITKSLNWI